MNEWSPRKRAKPMDLPNWIYTIRRELISTPIQSDPRTAGFERPLGVPSDVVFHEVVCGGQADFDAPWDGPSGRLSGDERALLYGLLNLKGHLLELVHAFEMLTGDAQLDDPVVIDLGCGPGTGGLALVNALGAEARFTYIGVDRAASMRALGERLMGAAEALGWMRRVERIWLADARELDWTRPISWRPVIIIASYLLASPTLDAQELVRDAMQLVAKIGSGDVVVLYTNTTRPEANRHFPRFCASLIDEHRFSLLDDNEGRITTGWEQERRLRYALFVRRAIHTLELGD